MNKVTQWLLQPYPFERRWKKALGAGLWAGVFVALFLFLFRPFGARIQEGEELYFLGYCSLFGLVTFFMTLLVHGFCLLLPSVFEEEKWRIWKEILFNFFFIGCIGFGNLVLVHIIWDVPLNGRTFWIWQGLTFAVGIFPALLGAFFGQEGFPFGIGAGDGVGHDEQLMERLEAQSGGKSASDSWPGCSSNGRSSTARRPETTE